MGDSEITHDDWPSEDYEDLFDLELEWLKATDPGLYESTKEFLTLSS